MRTRWNKDNKRPGALVAWLQLEVAKEDSEQLVLARLFCSLAGNL